MRRYLVGCYGANLRGDRLGSGVPPARLPGAQPRVRRFERGALQVAYAGPAAVPWGGPSRTTCLLDGWVDNLAALRAELQLQPQTEPEFVIACGYDRWQSGLFERLRGQFAAVLWDDVRGRGAVVRDQLGGGTLFLHSGVTLTFAWEVAELLGLLTSTPGPDDLAVVHWLAGRAIGDYRTLYAGVRALPAAHWLELADGRWTLRPYWSPVMSARRNGSETELARELGERVGQAVTRRLGNDSPAAILLSGGLDSSSVAALATAQGVKLRAFSAIFPEVPEVDESRRIERVCGSLGIPSVRADVTGGSAITGALEFLSAWALPAVSPNGFFFTPLLAAAARLGHTVLLDGEGGDELFGASPYLIADQLRGLEPRAALRLVTRLPGLGGAPGLRVSARALAWYGLRDALPAQVAALAARWLGHHHRGPAWLNASSQTLLEDSPADWDWRGTSGPRWWAYLSALLTTFRASGGFGEALRRRADLAGLEARPPLLDLDLVEFVLSLAPELAFDPCLDRPLLRRSVHGLLPDEVRLRPDKSYFNRIIANCLAGPDREPLRRLLGSRHTHVGRYVHLDSMRSALFSVPPRQGWFAWASDVWRLLTAETWLRQQADPAFAAQVLSNWDLDAAQVRILGLSTRSR